MNNGRDPSTQRHDFPKAGGDVTGDKQEPCNEPGKDEKSLISQEPSRKKSKEKTTPAGKGFLNSFFKITRRKKSPDPSSNEESSVAFESTSKTSLETSATTSGNDASFYSGAAPQSCKIVSPVTITQARRLPLCRSCRNSIASPISPGHESGFMFLEGNVQCIRNCSRCFRQDVIHAKDYYVEFLIFGETKELLSYEATQFTSKTSRGTVSPPPFNFCLRGLAFRHPRRLRLKVHYILN